MNCGQTLDELTYHLAWDWLGSKPHCVRRGLVSRKLGFCDVIWCFSHLV